MASSPPPSSGPLAPPAAGTAAPPRSPARAAGPSVASRETRPAWVLRLLPAGTVVPCPPGATALEAAVAAGAAVEAPCGGRRLCGRCRVVYEAGAPAPGPVEVGLIAAHDLAAGVRLACRSRPVGDASVRLLPPARLDGWKVTAAAEGDTPIDPDVRVLRCPPPSVTLERPTPSATWLREQLGDLTLPLPVLRTLRGAGHGDAGRDGAGGWAWEVVTVGE